MNCKGCGKFWEECQCDDASAQSRAGESGANLTDVLCVNDKLRAQNHLLREAIKANAVRPGFADMLQPWAARVLELTHNHGGKPQPTAATK